MFRRIRGVGEKFPVTFGLIRVFHLTPNSRRRLSGYVRTLMKNYYKMQRNTRRREEVEVRGIAANAGFGLFGC